MELDLEGKRALITGGSKGIGLACAHAFAAEGVNLAIAAREIESLKSVTKDLRNFYGVDVTSHSCDLAKPEHQVALAEVVSDVDILVNNAGAIPGGDLATLDEAQWRASWELKVFGYINLVRLLLPGMRKRGSGVVVNIIGAADQNPRADYVAGTIGQRRLGQLHQGTGGRDVSRRGSSGWSQPRTYSNGPNGITTTKACRRPFRQPGTLGGSVVERSFAGQTRGDCRCCRFRCFGSGQLRFRDGNHR